MSLGWAYYNGDGVLQDYKEAVKWYRMAAEQGDAAAQFRLGLMYRSGDGVSKDYPQSYAWLNLSANAAWCIAYEKDSPLRNNKFKVGLFKQKLSVFLEESCLFFIRP